MQLIQLGLIILSLVPAVATLLLGYQVMRAGFSLWGKPTIKAPLFYAAKLSIFVLFTLLVISACLPDFFIQMPLLIQNEIPAVQKLMSLIFLLAGNLLLLPAYYSMSIFTRVGLPANEHVLFTEGVYRISRNPMYTSFFFFFGACFLLIPSLFVGGLALFCLAVHHWIITAEERFLAKAFGDEYLNYKRRVARYL